MKRFSTKYPGVFFRIGERIGGTGDEKIFYAVFKKDGKTIESKIGRQYADDMTPARANSIRNDLIEGREVTRAKKREEKKILPVSLSDVWEHYKNINTANKGLKADDNRFMLHIAEPLGGKRIQDITIKDIDSLKLSMESCSPKTVKNTLELIVRLSNFSVNKQMSDGLKFKIEYPKTNNETTEDLSEDQFSSLMAELKKETNIDVKNIILIAIYTGMRRSEIFKLKWEDVSFERKTISLKNPKSGIDKIIPLNDLASDVFSNCIRYQSEYIFPASRGGGHRKSVSRAAKRIMRAAGVPDDFRPMHGLRHFFGTSLICNGVDIPTLQKLMTHSSPQMTLRYAKIRDEKLADASNRLVDIFGKK